MNADEERKRLLDSATRLEAQAAKVRKEAESWLRPQFLFQVVEADVGTGHPLGGSFHKCDVGKRVYLHRGQVSIENEEQRDARIAKTIQGRVRIDKRAEDRDYLKGLLR